MVVVLYREQLKREVREGELRIDGNCLQIYIDSK